MSDPRHAWTALTRHLRDVEVLEGLAELTGWDQQTMMPPKGAAGRGDQMAILSRLIHEAVADPRVGEWVAALEGSADLDDVQRATVRIVRRRHGRATRVPSHLVERMAQAQAAAFGVWVAAKHASDFASFAPHLQILLDLSQERAAAIDASRHPYDVLIEEMDPGTTVVTLKEMFARLRVGLAELIAAIGPRPRQPALVGRWPVSAQEGLNRAVAAALGFDFEAGRLDPTEHPFSSGAHPGDVRLTNHLRDDDLLGGLGGTIHEAGHGMYEQGLPTTWPGTLVGRAASFGLHESQSRLWENFVGRSEAFCGWLARVLPEHLGAGAPGADALYRASNRVEAGLIRVNADETTYNLHIIVRFELELALLEGRLAVRDLPEAWNAKYAESLGVHAENDGQGVLQDVHWSGGAFGYFPSYTLGNLYAASLGKTLEQQIPDLWEQIGAGRFGEILGWLRTNVHAKGSLREAPEIVREVTGDRDSVADLLDHLWNRQGALHGVTRAR